MGTDPVRFLRVESGLYESVEQHQGAPRFTIVRVQGWEVVDAANGDSQFLYGLRDAKRWAGEQPPNFFELGSDQ